MNETFEDESLDSREGYCTCLKGFRTLAQRRRGSLATAHGRAKCRGCHGRQFHDQKTEGLAELPRK